MNISQFINNLNNKKKLKLLPNIKKIFILTGAGISAESGISTFRDKDGLWNNYSVYEVARPEAMELTPDIFFNFQNMRAKEYHEKKPNRAHHSLKELESQFEVFIITQNIDNLHEQSNSSNIKHMHGKLHECYCNYCLQKFDYKEDIFGELCSYCKKGKIRPDVVLFKEKPKYLDEIYRLLNESDLFIQIGTSGNVYPAANLIKEFKKQNKPTINISMEKPENDEYADFSFLGKATKLVPYVVQYLLKQDKK